MFDEDQFFNNEKKKIKDILDGPRHTLKEEPEEKQYLTYLEKLTDFQENIKNVQTQSLEKQLEIKEINDEAYGPYDDIEADNFNELADKLIKRKEKLTPNSKLLKFNWHFMNLIKESG